LPYLGIWSNFYNKWLKELIVAVVDTQDWRGSWEGDVRPFA
jgi:hypothetical protein